MTTLDVDGFEIDIITLWDATSHKSPEVRVAASSFMVGTVIKSLTQDSKKRFEEYQEQNDPCKEIK